MCQGVEPGLCGKKYDGKETSLFNNRGSATVEMSFIMPVIIFIIMELIWLFLGVMCDGRRQGRAYVNLYSYAGENDMVVHNADGITCTGIYENDTVSDSVSEVRQYSTEYEKRTGRLRRWQLYGDVLSEQGNE